MTKPIPWSSDRKVDKSSLRVVLDWIKEGDNYARWSRGRVAKTTLCDEILKLLEAQGITYRKQADVRAKIWKLERNIAMARKMLAQKGSQGVCTLKNCEESLKNQILKRCAYFEELAPTMQSPELSPKRERISSRLKAKARKAAAVPETKPGMLAGRSPVADSNSVAMAGDVEALQRTEIQERIHQQRRVHELELNKAQVEFEAAKAQSQVVFERCKTELQAIERPKVRDTDLQLSVAGQHVPVHPSQESSAQGPSSCVLS